MLISAGIISKAGAVFLADFLPQDVKLAVSKHANNFLYTLEIEDDDIDLPYLETTHLRYTYKQTDDLYWLLVTSPESNLSSDVDLLGRLVCTIMEYGASETNSCTLTEEQKSMFYRHIWRPWDENHQCPTCGRYSHRSHVWDLEFNARLQFIRQIRDGHVSDEDVSYFNGLIAESWAINSKLSQKANFGLEQDAYLSDSDSFSSSEPRSISEETVVDGCRLSCQLEDIRLTISRIQDPYLRLFARRDLLAHSDFDPQAQTSSAPSFGELDTTCQS